MNHVLVFVASDRALNDGQMKRAREITTEAQLKIIGTPTWLCAKKAAEITISQKPQRSLLNTLRHEFDSDRIDVFCVPSESRRKKLLLADMESTIVDKEALDELAEFAGIRDKIAGITERAMNGELDFKAALMERVNLLRGMDIKYLQIVLESMRINAGAKTMIDVMKKNGATCVLVSGGFTFFTEAIAQQAGFDYHHGNILGVANGQLTGQVEEPILDKNAKLDFLKKYAGDLGLSNHDVMAVGDGANDLPMLKAAGTGLGYRPKPAVAHEVDNLIIHSDFTAALYIQGYSSF